ncbi:MAG TPA: PTS lactose/cellobiose transporter subunit IIA [Candidatus Faecalibacterium intestinigallinarum]|uniref:PTS lactose/cellobiose transporter subunit IIA n=1 Tax=Candidatus Faecalibacterium intestinigallinarum TaxID=2838581 RepID=A0A9D1QAY8_9FIRM|nr:PTS lactose/cellobiose transporter subunit IIA [Candidatus Faecalibacterium intestinigallinarum]
MDENLSDAIVMNLVVNSGEARSIAMEAIELARQGQFDEAAAKIAAARETINAAHNFQTELVQREVNNDPVPMSLLMCHGQDHLMTAMVVIDLAEKFIEVYQKLAR